VITHSIQGSMDHFQALLLPVSVLPGMVAAADRSQHRMCCTNQAIACMTQAAHCIHMYEMLCSIGII
jgi:hypothetical protein